MKTFKFKHSLASQGILTLANPLAMPGVQVSGAIVVEITDVPEEWDAHRAARALDHMVMPSWIHSVSAEQEGLNLYRAVNLTPAQRLCAPKSYRDKYLVGAVESGGRPAETSACSA